MVQSTVAPLLASCFNVFTTDMAKYASNPEVGSSAKMTGGSIRISVAIDNRFISPPEIVLVRPGVPITVS